MLVTAGAIVSVTILPLIETFVTVRVVLPVVTVKAVGSGAAPARLSVNTIVSALALTDVETTLGATVSGVLLTTAAGPKFAVSFFVGDALSRIRSPDGGRLRVAHRHGLRVVRRGCEVRA